MNVTYALQQLHDGLGFLLPEIILSCGIILLIVSGIIEKNLFYLFKVTLVIACISSALVDLVCWQSSPTTLFSGMIRVDDFGGYFKILIDLSGILAAVISRKAATNKPFEYFLFILIIVLGSHLLVMSINFTMIVLSMELISLSAYALTGFAFTRKATEGSLKYFLFGSVATAVTIYGVSILYGISGTLDFSSREFITALMGQPVALLLIGGVMTLAGFLFKISAAPFHLWVPDVYESSLTPVAAFFSIGPVLAGFGALTRFTLAMNLYGQSPVDWQTILCVVAILSLTVGNFSALWQAQPRRMMAYSSIAQSGFLLTGIAAISLTGVHAFLFYATVLLVANFLFFALLQEFETGNSVALIKDFRGLGKSRMLLAISFVIALVSLAGLPVTAGFTSKLLVFSALWDAYSHAGKGILLVLFVFGIVNTIVAVFFYLKIPYYLFLKEPAHPDVNEPGKIATSGNIVAFVLAAMLLVLFFWPAVLMGWINRINFVL